MTTDTDTTTPTPEAEEVPSYLCGECGGIAPAGAFKSLHRDDETDELRPSREGEYDGTLECPVCNHHHRDGDDGSGLWDGTVRELEVIRAQEVDDYADSWLPANVAAARERKATVVHVPRAGVLDVLNEPTDRLAAAVDTIAAYRRDLHLVEEVVRNEIARRLDAGNKRKAVVGEFELEANAPTSDEYLLDVLERELRELVEAGVLEAQVVDEVIVQPPPTTPARRVAVREVNKLKNHPDPRVLAAIAKARVRKTNRRTVKVNRKAAR